MNPLTDEEFQTLCQAVIKGDPIPLAKFLETCDSQQDRMTDNHLKQFILLAPTIVLDHFPVEKMSYEVAILLAQATPKFSLVAQSEALKIQWLTNAAADRNNLAIHYFCKCGIDVNTPLNDEGLTLFLAACYNQNFSLAKLLASLGANINVVTKTGNNAFHYLINRMLDLPQQPFDMSLLSWLVENVNINQCNENGETPLFVACFLPHRNQVIPALLKNKPKYVVSNKGSSPLTVLLTDVDNDSVILCEQILLLYKNEFSSSPKQLPDPILYVVCSLLLKPINHAVLHRVIKLLISIGANVNFTSPTGSTPILYAALAGDLSILRLLLDANANPNCLHIGKSGLPIYPLDAVLERAASPHLLECVQLLKSKGAKNSRRTLPIINELETPRKAPAKKTSAAPTADELIAQLNNLIQEKSKEIGNFLKKYFSTFLPSLAEILFNAASTNDVKFFKSFYTKLDSLCKNGTSRNLLKDCMISLESKFATETNPKYDALKKYLATFSPAQSAPSIVMASIPSTQQLPRSLTKTIHEACQQGSLSRVEELITSNPQALYAHDELGYTGLHYACKLAEEEFILFLLKHTALSWSVCTHAEDNGKTNAVTPLSILIAAGHTAIIHRILDRINWEIEPPYTTDSFASWNYKSTQLQEKIIQLSQAAKNPKPPTSITVLAKLSTPPKPMAAVAIESPLQMEASAAEPLALSELRSDQDEIFIPNKTATLRLFNPAVGASPLITELPAYTLFGKNL